MKIAFAVVKHIVRGGGIEKYMDELGGRLVEMGHEVMVYSMTNYGALPSNYKGMTIVPVSSIPLRQMEKLSASLVAGARLALSQWPDIVHFHSVGPGSAAWLARLSGKKTVIQMHGLEWKRSRWGKTGVYVHRFLEKCSLLTKSSITAVSKEQCKYFLNRYGIDAKYIPTGVNIKRKIPPNEIIRIGLKPKKYILFASRLVKEKGAHYLIPAFRTLDTEYMLVIAGGLPKGDKYTRELLTLAEGDKRIIFPGFVEGRLLEELFSNAAIYVQPSEMEGLSIALLEAMSYELPCLVSDIPENKEAIADCGITFLSQEINDLALKLSYMLKPSPNLQQLAKNAVRRVEVNYSWDSIAAAFNDYYWEILSS
ncbi:MAG: glycosyltransferase family 4 protein [Candidatus Hodarchaeota archaeon]